MLMYGSLMNVGHGLVRVDQMVTDISWSGVGRITTGGNGWLIVLRLSSRTVLLRFSCGIVAITQRVATRPIYFRGRTKKIPPMR